MEFAVHLLQAGKPNLFAVWRNRSRSRQDKSKLSYGKASYALESLPENRVAVEVASGANFRKNAASCCLYGGDFNCQLLGLIC
ncbi:hypothetical protein H6G76_16770 [Nostoc sp. FACHB-152]|nr:hypothetical protein [Nostoc sp. FACHB-152]MBD2467555.1 hypothetical protein [Nostoc sp. FACHB-145]